MHEEHVCFVLINIPFGKIVPKVIRVDVFVVYKATKNITFLFGRW